MVSDSGVINFLDQLGVLIDKPCFSQDICCCVFNLWKEYRTSENVKIEHMTIFNFHFNPFNCIILLILFEICGEVELIVLK